MSCLAKMGHIAYLLLQAVGQIHQPLLQKRLAQNFWSKFFQKGEWNMSSTVSDPILCFLILHLLKLPDLSKKTHEESSQWRPRTRKVQQINRATTTSNVNSNNRPNVHIQCITQLTAGPQSQRYFFCMCLRNTGLEVYEHNFTRPSLAAWTHPGLIYASVIEVEYLS